MTMQIRLLAALLTAPLLAPLHPDPNPGPSMPTSTRRIGDAEIIGTIGTVDANVIEAAKLATTKAKSQEVHDYAKMLLADHQRSQQAGLRLAKQLHIAPILPADSSITRNHKQEMDQLNLISASAFDKAFVQYMVADHKMILNKIDAVLLPAASHLQLKRFIRNLEPTLTRHEAKGQEWLDKQQP
jgi:putative membrane protein